MLKLGPSKGLEANTHNMFKLKLKWMSEGSIPLTHYFEVDVKFLGLKVPKVEFLVARSPCDLLDQGKNTKLPGIVGWNLIGLVYQELPKSIQIPYSEILNV